MQCWFCRRCEFESCRAAITSFEHRRLADFQGSSELLRSEKCRISTSLTNTSENPFPRMQKCLSGSGLIAKLYECSPGKKVFLLMHRKFPSRFTTSGKKFNLNVLAGKKIAVVRKTLVAFSFSLSLNFFSEFFFGNVIAETKKSCSMRK